MLRIMEEDEKIVGFRTNIYACCSRLVFDVGGNEVIEMRSYQKVE